MFNIILPPFTMDDIVSTGPNDGPPIYTRATVTPSLARQMLTRNTQNRTLNDKYVATLMRDMAAGTWRENGDALRFSWDGVMLDGQHKAKACERAGVPINIMVVTNLDPATQDTMDGGRKRSAQDMLTLADEPNAATLATVIRRVWMWENGDRRLGSYNGPTKPEMRKLLNEYPSLRRSASIGKRVANEFRFAAPGVVGTGHFLFSRIDQDTAVWFFQKFGDGLDIQTGDPVGALRTRLMNDSRDGLRKSDAKLMTYMVSAWNGVREGRTMSRVAPYEKGQTIPEPK